jgi:uncharacterized protein YkwD
MSSAGFGTNPYIDSASKRFLKSPIFHSEINLSQINMDLIEAGVFFLSNEYRIQKNRTALRYNEALSFAAYTHSEQMYIYDFFDHTNKKNKVLSSLEKRVENASYNNYVTLAENIFHGFIDLNKVGTYESFCTVILAAFLSSKKHREIIIAKDVKELGCGVYFDHDIKEGYWYYNFTQNFGQSFEAL